MLGPLWWENGNFPPPHRPCLGKPMLDGALSSPAPSSLHMCFFLTCTPFILPHALLFTTHFSSLRVLLFTTHFSSSHVSLHHRFLHHRLFFSVFLNSCLYISDLNHNSNLSLSLSAATCSQRSSSQEPQQMQLL